MKYKLGDLLSIKHGYPFKGEFFSDEGEMIILTPANFFEEGGFKYTPGKEKYYIGDVPSEYICKKGDLIVAMTQQAEGLLGSTAFIPEDNKFLHNQRIGLITVNEDKLIPEYADYLFRTKSVRKQIRGSASGTKVKHTSPEKIYEVEVDIPDVHAQSKIAGLLSTIDKKIGINADMISDFENLASFLYDYWFVQFDFPNEQNRPYKSSGGRMVWNEVLHREIPEGWEVCKFDDIVMPAPKCKSIKAPDYKKNGKYPIVDQASTLITGYTDEEQYLYDASNGSVIFGDVTTCLKFINFPFAKGTDGTKIINTYNNRIPALLMYYMLQGYKLPDVGFARHYMFLREIMLLVPPVELCQKYEDILRAAMDKRREGIMENKQLEDIREFLLPLLLNGQAKVVY